MKQHRKDNPKQSVKAISTTRMERNDPPPQLKAVPVFPIELQYLPTFRPIRCTHIPCPRCGCEITSIVKAGPPIPSSFRPFYERALEGDLRALVEYFKRSWHRSDLGGAFYQCLGYMAAKGFPEHIEVVEAVLRIHKTGGTWNKQPAKRAIYRSWRQTFMGSAKKIDGRQTLGPAKEIRQWIRNRRRALDTKGETMTRDVLWLSYVNENLPKLDLKAVANDFYHKHLKDLFWLLADTKRRLSPSQAARRVACKIAGISESSVSHKNVRK